MHWKDKGGDFEQPPLGSHVARCIGVIDLGTRTGTFGPKRDVMIRWELPTEKMSAKDEVFTVAAFFTQSLSEKANLRKALTSWRGRDFKPEELKGFHGKKMLGAPCLVNVVEKANQKGDLRHVVSNLSPVPKGMTVPAQINESIYLSLEPDEYDAKAFAALSEKIQDMVKESPEWRALQNGVHPEDGSENHFAEGVSDDDIPF